MPIQITVSSEPDPPVKAAEDPKKAQVQTRTPVIRQEPKKVEGFTPITMAVDPELKKKIRNNFIWPAEGMVSYPTLSADGRATGDSSPLGRLVIDDTGTYATDGRENLPLDFGLVKLLLREFSTDGKGRVWEKVSPVKVTICGTSDDPMLVVLNGRQRVKSIRFINQMVAEIHALYLKLGQDHTKLVNTVTTQSEAAAKGQGFTDPTDYSWLDPEDVTILCGGKINGIVHRGFLKKTAESSPEDGPLPYQVRVEYTDINPNEPSALLLAQADRKSVKTPPSVEARNIQRLKEAGFSQQTIATYFDCHPKTLQNRLLILRVVPEVQQAVDVELISWLTMIDQFFINKKKHDPLVKDPKEQLAILGTLIDTNAGKGRAGRLLRERLIEKGVLAKPTSPVWRPPAQPAPAPGSPAQTQPGQQAGAVPTLGSGWPVGLKCAAPDCGLELTPENASKLPNGNVKHTVGCLAAEKVPGVAVGSEAQRGVGAVTTVPVSQPAQAAPSQYPTPTATPAKQAAKKRAQMDHLPRAASALLAKLELVPQPDASAGPEAFLHVRDLRSQVEGAALVMKFLGGDGAAIDAHPELKDLVMAALAQGLEEQRAAEEAPPPAAPQTPQQLLAAAVVRIFSDWDGAEQSIPWPSYEDSEGRASKDGGWPTNADQRAACTEAIGKIQADYATAVGAGGAAGQQDRGEFAQGWVLRNLLGMADF